MGHEPKNKIMSITAHISQLLFNSAWAGANGSEICIVERTIGKRKWKGKKLYSTVVAGQDLNL